MPNALLARSLALAVVLGVPPLAFAAECGKQGVAVQVLGSGGPIADDARASSGYLIWQDGRARVMVDAGGGAFVRFGESGAKIEDLELIAISHFHVDHAGEVPAIVKSGYFSDRTAPLRLSGPSKSGPFPDLKSFLRSQFDAESGAFGYLSWVLDGEGGPFKLEAIEVSAKSESPKRVLDLPDLKVDAVGVVHGPVPALGYLVTAGKKRIAFTGDQNGQNPDFWKMAKDADLAIVHLAIPETAEGAEAKLHARPGEIGENVAKAGVKHLVLSHLMARSLKTMDDNLERIKAAYKEPVDVATDLACYPVSD